MATRSHVALTRLHGERLRTRIDHLIRELTMIEQMPNERLASPSVTTQLQAVEQQSEHITNETLRLHKFVRSLLLESTQSAAVDAK